jgi:hypothetical protein
MIYDIWYFPFVWFLFLSKAEGRLAGPQCAVYTVYRRRQQVINQQATSVQAASVDRGHARARARAP